MEDVEGWVVGAGVDVGCWREGGELALAFEAVEGREAGIGHAVWGGVEVLWGGGVAGHEGGWARDGGGAEVGFDLGGWEELPVRVAVEIDELGCRRSGAFGRVDVWFLCGEFLGVVTIVWGLFGWEDNH